MDKTEQAIWNITKEMLPYIKKQALEMEHTTNFMSIPYLCDGVIDYLLFDYKLDKFVQIDYSVGMGDCEHGFMSKFSGWFDEKKFKTLDISDFPQ